MDKRSHFLCEVGRSFSCEGWLGDRVFDWLGDRVFDWLGDRVFGGDRYLINLIMTTNINQENYHLQQFFILRKSKNNPTIISNRTRL